MKSAKRESTSEAASRKSKIAAGIERTIANELDRRLKSIRIPAEKAFGFMGYGASQAPLPMQQVLGDALGQMFLHAAPCASVSVFSVVKPLESGIECAGVAFLTGPIIASGLCGSDFLAVFTATCGCGMDEWYESACADGELLLGYAVDCIGSLLAEEICSAIDRVTGEVSESMCLGITMRYSPGYCGWSVSEQKKLFSLINGRDCGVSLSESSLMLPMKSASGIIGIGKYARRLGYECAACDRKTCVIARKRSRGAS